MPIHNSNCAAVCSEIADLFPIQGANSFRGRAYPTMRVTWINLAPLRAI